MDDAKQIMHERFWELRKDWKLTLEQLEKQTGISKSALGSYEAESTKDISHWTVVRLAEFYGVTTDYLLGLSVMKNHPNADLNDLRLSDEMIELLKSGRINNRLLCELAAHGDFRRFMLDLEIYVDRIASMHIRNNNTVLKTERKVLMERAGLDDNDLNMRTLVLAQIDEDDYFAHVIFEDLRPIIRDIREAHKSDATTADADMESPAEKAVRQLEAAFNCEGSKEENLENRIFLAAIYAPFTRKARVYMAEQTIQVINDMGQNAKKRIVCLYRVSTIGQVDKDDIPMQKQSCRGFCRQHPGWEIVKEFSEKGVSGFKVSAKDRDAIQEIQKMALQGEFDILLVFMFDRLGRKDDETPFVVEWFVKQNIEVWSAMEGQQRFDNHVDKLLNYIRYWQASGESIKTSLRVKTRLEQLTQEGLYSGGRTPFGYRLEKTGRMNKKNQDVRDLVVEPEDAEIVKLIFQKYVYEGCGALRICRYLAEQNIRRKDGKMISVGIINRAIQNPIYIGVLQRGASKSEVLPALKIIDENVFARAQEIISARAVQHREVPLTTRGKSLLVGNVYCGCCGARLVLTTSGRKYRRKDGTVVTGSYSSYKCCNRTLAPGKCDGQTSFSVEKLDNLVEQIVRIQFEQIQKAPPQALLEKQRSRKIELAKVKVKRLEGEYRQKQRAYQDLRAETLKVIQGSSHFSAGLLNSLIEETATQLKDLENQVQTAEMKLRDIVSGAEQDEQEYAQLMNWAGLYDKCSFESRKMIVAQFVKAVHVKRGYELDIEFNVSFEEFQTLYLEPEAEGDKRKRRGWEILALAENA